MKHGILFLLFCALASPTFGQSLPAFPGAQGGGAASLGGSGRNGTGPTIVFEVTNTNDSGNGSLRNCLQSSGARTCVFKVAGIFPTQSEIIVNNPYLTIACQTAPGEVILGGPTTQDVLRISTHDVITRYCTFSPDNANIQSGPSAGTVGYSVVNTTAYNIIADHITTRWAGNKEWLMFAGFDGESNSLTTLQWSMLYEPHEGHPVGPSTSELGNLSITQASGNVDFHHNLLVNIDHRIPEMNITFRWVNNITYNVGTYAVLQLGPPPMDIINNIFDCNDLCPAYSGVPIFNSNGANDSGSPSGTPSIYASGNITFGQSTPTSNQFSLVHQALEENIVTDLGAAPSNWQRNTPMASPNSFPIAADLAVNLWSVLKPTVGNSQHLDLHGNWVGHRDPEDTRIVNQYDGHGTGGYWPNGTHEAGVVPLNLVPTSQWQDHPQTGFSACTSSLHDGICDQWKTDNSFSTTDPNLFSRIAPNGYTYLENFINGSGAAAIATPPPVQTTNSPLPPTGVSATAH